MINPAEIVDNLVDLLRAVPEILEEIGGDEDRIFAYHDRYGRNVSLDAARYQMPSPSIMVAWQGTSPGSFGGFESWKHDVSINLRAGKEEDGEDPAGYYRLFRLITKGVPTTGDGQAMVNTVVHASCHPMDTPAIRRQTDAAGVDYFEVAMSFTEIGDD